MLKIILKQKRVQSHELRAIKLAWNLELCFHCAPNLERLILWKINCLCMVSLSAGPQPCGNDVLNVLGSSFTQMLTNFT